MFNSRFKTEKLEEALDILPELFALANEVLSSSEIDKSERLSLMLVGSKADKEAAIKELKDMVGKDPKRPLYYANYELDLLPRWTRNAVRYLGDYIDQLCKHWAFLLTENKIWLKRSLGQCLHLIKDKVGDKNVKLLNILTEYNHIIYDTAKHDFNLPQGRKDHRITSKEVVYTAFITKKLSREIKEITKCNSQLTCHNGEMSDHTV